AGTAAGNQGGIAILVHCGGPPNVFALLIPAGQAGGPVPRTFNEIPAGSTCTVTEVVDGRTETVSVVGGGSGQQVGVQPADTVTADLTNTFSPITPVGPENTTTPTTTAPLPGETVTGAESESLPFTGGETARWVWDAVAVVALGAALSVTNRRRRAR